MCWSPFRADCRRCPAARARIGHRQSRRGQQAAARVEERRRPTCWRWCRRCAEHPTLKAAVDTWHSERGAEGAMGEALVATVQREADKVAARIDADVLALVDVEGRVMVSSGPHGWAWTRGDVRHTRAPQMNRGVRQPHRRGVRVIACPCVLVTAIGSLEIGHAIDTVLARNSPSSSAARAWSPIDGGVVATTLSGCGRVEHRRAPLPGTADLRL